MSSYRVECVEGTCRLYVSGSLTAVLIPEIQQVLRKELAGGAERITFDLAETSMVDSSGIGLMIATSNSQAQNPGSIAVINTAPEIVKLLASMRLVSRLKVSGRPVTERQS